MYTVFGKKQKTDISIYYDREIEEVLSLVTLINFFGTLLEVTHAIQKQLICYFIPPPSP